MRTLGEIATLVFKVEPQQNPKAALSAAWTAQTLSSNARRHLPLLEVGRYLCSPAGKNGEVLTQTSCRLSAGNRSRWLPIQHTSPRKAHAVAARSKRVTNPAARPVWGSYGMTHTAKHCPTPSRAGSRHNWPDCADCAALNLALPGCILKISSHQLEQCLGKHHGWFLHCQIKFG